LEKVNFIKIKIISFFFIRIDDDSTSNETSSESDDRSITIKKKISVTFLESLSNYVPLEDKHPDAKS
jgi:hypothetical protein